MIKNIIWDLDGTMFDTYPAIVYAIGESLEELGLPVSLTVIDGYARQSLDYCMETLAQQSKVEPDLLRRRFVEFYRAVPAENQPLFPKVRDVCALIHDQGGLNIIVTHRGVESSRRILAAHNLTSLVAGIFSIEQGYPRKPDPGIFQAALQQFGLDRSTTLAVGDREIDIQGGRAAGLRTGLFGNAELSEAADYRLEDYGQLLALLMEAAG